MTSDISDFTPDSSRERWIFDHVPKTAGTSFYAVARELIGDHAVVVLPNGYAVAQAEARLAGSIRLVGGHLAFHPGHDIPEEIGFFTFLRDPIARAESLYHHARHLSPLIRGTYVERAHALTLDDFVDSDEPLVRDVISNVFTRHFAAPVADSREPLERAWSRLSKYRFVGFQEDFEHSVIIFAALAGWGVPAAVPKLNISVQWHEPLRPATSETLRKLNMWDLELLERARSLYTNGLRLALHRKRPRHHSGSDPEPIVINDGAKSDPPAEREPVQFGTKEIRFFDVALRNADNGGHFYLSGEILEVTLRFFSVIAYDNVTVGMSIHGADRAVLFGTNLALMQRMLQIEAYHSYECRFLVKLDLGIGDYYLGASIHTGLDHNEHCFDWQERIGEFSISGHALEPFAGAVRMDCRATVTNLGDVQPLSDFSARLEISEALKENTFRVRATNLGAQLWPHRGPIPVRVGCRFLDGGGDLMPDTGIRASLPSTLRSSEVATVEICVQNVPRAARVMRFTLTQESIAWFDQMGGSRVDIPIPAS